MKNTVICLFMAFICFFSCSRSGDAFLTNAERGQIESSIDQLADEMIERVRAIDLQGAFAIYDRNDFQAFNHASSFLSYQELEAAYAPVFDDTKTWEIEWKSKDITVLGPDAALLQGVTTVTSYFKNGWVNHFPTGYITLLFQKKGEEWMATRFHQSWEGPVFPRGDYTTTLTAEDTGDPVKGVADWRVNFDDQYNFIVYRNGEKAVVGKYQVMGNVIRFYNEEGAYACTDTPESYYRYRIGDEGLTLEPLKDECEGRQLVYGTHPLKLN